MTLRDYFAAAALPLMDQLQGAIDEDSREEVDKRCMNTAKGYAAGAYRIADAMLAEREKRNG